MEQNHLMLQHVRAIFKKFISDLFVAAINVKGTYYIFNDST